MSQFLLRAAYVRSFPNAVRQAIGARRLRRPLSRSGRLWPPKRNNGDAILTTPAPLVARPPAQARLRSDRTQRACRRAPEVRVRLGYMDCSARTGIACGNGTRWVGWTGQGARQAFDDDWRVAHPDPESEPRSRVPPCTDAAAAGTGRRGGSESARGLTGGQTRRRPQWGRDCSAIRVERRSGDGNGAFRFPNR